MVQFRFQIAAVQDGRGYCVNPEGQDQGKRWGASDVPGQVRDYTILHLDWSLFFSWAMWKYLDVYLTLLFRCEDTRVQLNTEITAREEAEAEVKWQWHKSDRFAKFHIWCQVNNCSRKVKMLEEKIEKNDERWALGSFNSPIRDKHQKAWLEILFDPLCWKWPHFFQNDSQMTLNSSDLRAFHQSCRALLIILLSPTIAGAISHFVFFVHKKTFCCSISF